MERVGDAFVWPFRDPKWLEKVAIIGLISLIPIIGTINGLGWMLASIDRLREGKQELPPGNFEHLGRGVLLFVVFLVYAIALLVVGGGVFILGFVLLAAGGQGNGNAALAFVGVVVTLLALGVILVVTLAFFFARPAVVLATDHGGVAAGLDVPSILRRMRMTPTNTLIAGLMLLAAGFISQLGSYACVIGLIFTIPYALAIEAWIIRSYEEGLDVGRSAPAAAPER